jgi:hypothetical protein
VNLSGTQAVTIVQEALEAWREAERLLDQVPTLDPDHETVALAVASLREAYLSLTDGASERTPEVIEHSRDTIGQTRELLDRVHSKLQRGYAEADR